MDVCVRMCTMFVYQNVLSQRKLMMDLRCGKAQKEKLAATATKMWMGKKEHENNTRIEETEKNTQ